MSENYKTTRLKYASVIFIAIIIIGFLAIRKPDIEYAFTMQETIDEIQNQDYRLLPEDVAYNVDMEEPGFVYVDLRSPYEFVIGSVGASVNIPANVILDPQSLEFFTACVGDSLTVVLIGTDEAEATGPWLLLKQIGFNNIKVMKGGWQYYANEPLDPYDMPDLPKYQVEEPKYDFVEIMEMMKENPYATAPVESQEVILPTRKNKKSVVEGGC